MSGLPTNPEVLVGSLVGGRYRLGHLLGAGAMGAVFHATDSDGSVVAVKIVDRKRAGKEGAARFVREATLASQLNSVHVTPSLAAGEDAATGTLFLVMPLLQGRDLEDVLRKVGPLHPSVAARVIRQACAGVAAAHVRGVVHRDLKPSNLFLETAADGEVVVRVCDFGISKQVEMYDDAQLTATGTALGSPLYMAPEQLKSSKHVDERADVWSLGVSLYECLTGAAPFAEAVTVADLFVSVCTRNAPPVQGRAPWVEPALARIVHRALHRDVERRFAGAAQLAEALAPFTDGEDRLTSELLRPLADEWRAHVAQRAELRSVQLDESGPESSAASDADPLIGRSVDGRFRLLRLLGRGGMGSVYEADAPDGGRVAVKVVTRDAAGPDEATVRRFVREAKTASLIEHPNVVRTIETGADAALGTPYIVMELLDGVPLAALYRRQGAIEPTPLVRAFVQAARGIAAAHAKGFVHRDIKPSNIFLHVDRATGRVVSKVCDFGIAKQTHDDGGHEQTSSQELTRTGGMLGSPLYMSPEQARNAKHADPRADIWSLGVSLYQGLAGRHLWEGRNTLGEIIVAICTDPIAPLSSVAPWVDPRLAEVVHRCLERDPAARWQSLAELVTALEPLTGGTLDVDRDELLGVDEQRRSLASSPSASSIPIPVKRARSVSAIAAIGELSTMAAGAQAASMRPVKSARRRALFVVAAAVGALGVAGAVAIALQRPPQRATAEAAGVSAAPPPSPSPPPSGAPLVEPIQAPARSFEAKIEIRPATASVTVDDKPVTVVDGSIALSGAEGTEFKVVATASGRSSERAVRMRPDGTPSISSIEVQVPRGTKAGGAPAPVATTATAAKTAPAAAAPAATAPPKGPAMKPTDSWGQ